MAVDGYGTQNQPTFDGNKASNLAADLTAVSNYAAEVGNRKVGPHAARVALSGADLWDGLEFYETDALTGHHNTFVWDVNLTAWRSVLRASAPSSTGLVSLASGWTFSPTGSQSWIQSAGRVEFTATFFRSGGTITVPADGNVTNVAIGTFSIPPQIGRSFPSGGTGRLAHFVVSNSGTLTLCAVTPGTDITNGAGFSVSGDYIY